MSSLKYYVDEGPAVKIADPYHYSSAIIVGVKCSGQGGWDRERNLDPHDQIKQVELAFQNVDHVLQGVGLRGWEDV